MNQTKLLHNIFIIVGKTVKDIIKHWRQDWLYDNIDLYTSFNTEAQLFKRR